MRKSTATLIGLNLLLLLAIPAVIWTRQSTESTYSTSALGVGATERLSDRDRGGESSPPVARSFDWYSARAVDLHPFVAALREVECPPPTIEDIIVAEVNRRFAGRERALKLRPDDYALWDPPPRGDASLQQRRSELRRLYEEKRALLRELLGWDAVLEMPAALRAGVAYNVEAVYAQVPAEKRAAVRAVHERYRAAVEHIRAQSLGFFTDQDLQNLDRLKGEQHLALSGFLTADELSDFEFAGSKLSQLMVAQLRSASLTADEQQSIARNWQQRLQTVTFTDLAQSVGQVGAQVSSLLDSGGAVAEVLGAERAAQIKRARDPTYRMYQTAFARAGIPRDQLDGVYEAQQRAIQEVHRLASDQARSSSERQRMIQESMEVASRTLRETVGEEAFNKLLESDALPLLRARQPAPTGP